MKIVHIPREFLVDRDIILADDAIRNAEWIKELDSIVLYMGNDISFMTPYHRRYQIAYNILVQELTKVLQANDAAKLSEREVRTFLTNALVKAAGELT